MAWYQTEIFWVIVKVAVILFVILTGGAYYTLAERRWAAFFQMRLGPNRAGFWGLLQPLADGIKFILKMETFPRNADLFLFMLAPVISTVTSLMLWGAIPFTPIIELPEAAQKITGSKSFILQVSNPNAGVLYMFAVSSLAVYGILIAGWSSNNKYSLLASVRSTAQMISYELSLGLSIIPIILMTGSLDLYTIIETQKNSWFLFTLPGFLAFWIFLVSIFAESNRMPFDLAEAESELIVGYHTEYGGFKFAFFMISEYMNLITLSLLAAILFLGGWTLPDFISSAISNVWLQHAAGIGLFLLKAFFFVFLFVWVRWSVPRFRYDQLMDIGWKVMLPASLVIVFIAGIYVYLK